MANDIPSKHHMYIDTFLPRKFYFLLIFLMKIKCLNEMEGVCGLPLKKINLVELK